jgi:hypothetical protein
MQTALLGSAPDFPSEKIVTLEVYVCCKAGGEKEDYLLLEIE